MSENIETQMTLDEGIAEVLGLLTGLDLQYMPESDRYQAITRAINRALRAIAREKEWSYFAGLETIGTAVFGQRIVPFRNSIRPRIINDDAVRLVEPNTGRPLVWAYFLPRDALHKYPMQQGLWCAHTRQVLEFSRPFLLHEDGLDIQVPIMREPRMFKLPTLNVDTDEVESDEVLEEIREQQIDFDNPDLVIAKAAYFYAQTHPLMQPRVQTLDQNYKDIMYALTERDDRNTDTPYQNEWSLGIESGINGNYRHTDRPSADWQDRIF